MKMNKVLIIYGAFLACVPKQWFETEIVRSLELQDVGYQGCCPEPAFAVSSCGAQSGVLFRFGTNSADGCKRHSRLQVDQPKICFRD
jgi:hypothetical protein